MKINYRTGLWILSQKRITHELREGVRAARARQDDATIKKNLPAPRFRPHQNSQPVPLDSHEIKEKKKDVGVTLTMARVRRGVRGASARRECHESLRSCKAMLEERKEQKIKKGNQVYPSSSWSLALWPAVKGREES